MRSWLYFIPVVIFSVLACWPSMAAAVNDKELGKSMLSTLIKHELKPFEQSKLNDFYPRSSIAAGLGEKIANKIWDENGDTLGFMLTESGQPSNNFDNPYVDVTKGLNASGNSYEGQLASRIMSSGGSLEPSDVMGMALEVCDGDYWLATLACHNLLKEVAYAGRTGQRAVVGWDAGNYLDANQYTMLDATDITDKLKNLRPAGDPHSGDLIGPWYHMYGLLFVGGMTSGSEADFMAATENLTRKLGLGSSGDAFKEQMNTWAANLSHAMNEMVTAGVYAPEDLSPYSKDELQVMFDAIRAKHRSYQEDLERLAGIVNDQRYGDWAVWRMDVIRDIQQSLYQEALRVRDEMNSR